MVNDTEVKEEENNKIIIKNNNMIKNILTGTVLALALTSCTADKFEQIDANFAELELRDARLNDLISVNTTAISTLDKKVNATKAELTNVFSAAVESNTDLINSLTTQSNELAQELADGNSALIAELNVAQDNLKIELDAQTVKLENALSSINAELDSQNELNEQYVVDKQKLEADLVDATGDLRTELLNNLEAIKVENNVEFDLFQTSVNELLAKVPSDVRLAVSVALKEIAWANDNILAIVIGESIDVTDAADDDDIRVVTITETIEVIKEVIVTEIQRASQIVVTASDTNPARSEVVTFTIDVGSIEGAVNVIVNHQNIEGGYNWRVPNGDLTDLGDGVFTYAKPFGGGTGDNFLVRIQALDVDDVAIGSSFILEINLSN